MATVPLSEWINLKQQANKNALGVSEWTRTFLEPLNQQVESTAQAYQASANYDITQAYQNYKKQQLALMGSNLTAGKKEDYSSSLSSAFQQSAFQTKQKLASDLSDLSTQYNKALSSEYASLEKYATQMQELEEAVFTRAGVNRTQAEQAGWYDFDRETNQYSINDVGKANISRVLYDVMKDESGSAKTFGDWLYDYNPDLYNFYATNRADVNELLLGENRALSNYDKDKYGVIAGSGSRKDGIATIDKIESQTTSLRADDGLVERLNARYGNLTTYGDVVNMDGKTYMRVRPGKGENSEWAAIDANKPGVSDIKATKVDVNSGTLSAFNNVTINNKKYDLSDIPKSSIVRELRKLYGDNKTLEKGDIVKLGTDYYVVYNDTHKWGLQRPPVFKLIKNYKGGI